MSTPAQSDDERDDLNFEREEQLAAFCRARLDRVTQRTLRSAGSSRCPI